jgi:hypothetical protein
VPGDYYGDGRTDLAVFRPNTAEWFIARSTLGPTRIQFGPAAQSFPVPADYDGDGRTDLAVFLTTTSQWYILRSAAGFESIQFGPGGQSIPVPADYDGDGKADVAVYVPVIGEWFLLRSGAGYLAQQFGMPYFDTPVTAPIEYRLSAGGFAFTGRSVHAASVGTTSGGSAIAVASTADPGNLIVVPAQELSPPTPRLANPGRWHSRRDAHAFDAALAGALGELAAERARS